MNLIVTAHVVYVERLYWTVLVVASVKYEIV